VILGQMHSFGRGIRERKKERGRRERERECNNNLYFEAQIVVGSSHATCIQN
jgi:hypothetical protein